MEKIQNNNMLSEISVLLKMEDFLEKKLQALISKLIATDDETLLLEIKAEIENTRKDLEDLKKAWTHDLQSTK